MALVSLHRAGVFPFTACRADGTSWLKHLMRILFEQAFQLMLANSGVLSLYSEYTR